MRKHIVAENTKSYNISASVALDYYECEQVDMVRLTLDWSAGSSLDGAITLQASNDAENWYTLDLGVTIPITGATGNHVIDVTEVNSKYIRRTFNK